MKYYLLNLLFFISFFVNAQQVTILEDQVDYEEATFSSFSIYLAPDTKEVKKELKKYMGDKYDVRMKGIGFLTNKDVLYAKGVNIDAISEKKMDFYAKVIEENDRTKLSFFGAYGYDITIDSTVDYQAYKNIRKSLVGFIAEYLPGYYTEQVEEAKEKVEDLQEDKADLYDDIADNKDDIEGKLAEIDSLKKEIKELVNKLEETTAKLNSSEQELKNTKATLNKVKAEIKGLGDN